MMLKKKALALAVAGAIGVPAAAFAETSNVEIYGRLYPEFTVGSTSGATAAGTTGMSTLAGTLNGLNAEKRGSVDASNSRIGFRGSEGLGGEMKAIYQIESTVVIDSGTNAILATRDSFVGIDTGRFGTVRLGNMETVFKTLGDPLGFLGLTSGNFGSLSNSISSRQTFGTSSSGSFHLRRANSIIYETPDLSGFKVLVDYSPDETHGNPGTGLDANLVSVGVQYKRGPLEVGIANEVHNDFFAGSNNAPAALANPTTGLTGVHSKDTGTRATVLYSISPKTKVQFNVATVKFSESGGAAGKFESYKNMRWSLTWEQGWTGPWRTAVGYGTASAGSCALVGGANCTTTGLGINQLTVAADYSFSKKSALFIMYSKLNNSEGSQARNTENIPAPNPGGDIMQYAVGVRYDI